MPVCLPSIPLHSDILTSYTQTDRRTDRPNKMDWVPMSLAAAAGQLEPPQRMLHKTDTDYSVHIYYRPYASNILAGRHSGGCSIHALRPTCIKSRHFMASWFSPLSVFIFSFFSSFFSFFLGLCSYASITL